jgi:hypothetical protein
MTHLTVSAARLLRVAAFLLVLLPASKSHAGTLTFCAKWWYSYLDQGMGEDGLTHASGFNYNTTQASYAWVNVTRNGSDVVPGAWLNSSGCTSALTAQTGTWVVTVRTELQHPTGPTFQVRQGTPSGAFKEFSYTRTVTSTANNMTHTVALGQAAPADPVPNAMAVATQFVRESHIGLAPENTHKIVVQTSGGSFASGTVAYLGVYDGVSDGFWKHVIGHEVGHTIQYKLFGSIDHDYSKNETLSLCNCSHVPAGDDAHCLQSKEDIVAAQQEGWGHFIALDLMNDDTQSDASFIYCKGFRCPSNVTGLPGCQGSASQVKAPPMAFDGRRQHRWLDNYCSANSVDRGTEMDWMNFYYSVHTTGGSNQFFFTQFRDTYVQACGGGTCQDKKPKWVDLKLAAEAVYGFGSGRALQWSTKGRAYGVDQ